MNPGRLHVATDLEGQAVGHFLLRPEESAGAVRLALVLVAPAARGQGYGEAMVKAALDTAFTDPDVHQVTLAVYAHNHGAKRPHERLGLREERVTVRSVQVGDAWWSSIAMSLPRNGWTSGVLH